MSVSSPTGSVGASSLKVLSDDGERILCRGWREDGNGVRTAVLAVLSASQHPTPSLVDRLIHECGLKDELDGWSAVRALELVRERGQTMLLLEDPGGEPLAGLLGQPMEMGRFLHIAVGLAGALRRLHERGFIHKDIKPANVLVNAETGRVWLMGFGIASRLPREHQAPAPPEVIAGTLAYMAPEQTGRMNRSVDDRSDLYALGVTFYEMLTGQLPFTAADPMEWVHCHIARQPVPPSERVAGVPRPLSAIVMKLLAKTAEERYQTAAGVEADLRRGLAEWESHGRIEPFPFGAEDAPDRLLIPEHLYGREREIVTLLASFNRVAANGTFELVLVSGYSGIGKSSVVNELHKVLVPRGLFASGKFDQYKRDIPYATVGQAFQSLVGSLLTKSEEELGRWRVSLKEALGRNAQLMVNLVPELELVIGKQPPVADLPPQDAQNRFHRIFRRFLAVFARKEHPLALFLDDLQWLDAATLDLLEDLATQPDVRHLMLVGAYRDNEVSPSHPLLRTLEAIRNAGARVEEIVLAPLGLDDVGQLAADAMRCDSERVRPLAQLVQEKTGGNPFFAIQFLTALAEEGLLAFDPVTRAWQWQMDRIRAKSYADNVVDLMAGKLKRFTGTSQEALKQLACLGNVAPTANLALVHGTTEEATHAALWEAVHAGLVLREDGAYRFLHDRIQQAAYSLIADEQRADVHLRIGRALLASTTADDLTEHLFDVANQFNRGAARLVDRDEKAQVATIDLRAGRKAKASAAFASARAYFAGGMALLDERDWGSQYELMFDLRLERAECEFLSGDFDKAEQLIAELLQRGASKVDQAAVYHLKILLHTVKSENAQAVASALTGLRLFGIDIPAHPTGEQVQAEYEAVWQTLNGRPIESLIDLPLMTDPEQQAAMQVLSTLLGPAYFTEFHLFCVLVCRMVNVSTQHGICGASAHAYGYWGIVLGPVFHRYREGYRSAKLACDLVEKHGFIDYRAKAYRAMGIAALWTQPITTALDFNRAAFRAASETGDLTYACYSVDRSVLILLLRNDPLDAVWRESERGLDFVRKAGYGAVADNIVSQQRFIATMQGRTPAFPPFSDAQFDEAAFEAQLTANRTAMMACFYWIIKLKTRFLSGDYAEAFAAADKAKALRWISATHIQLLDYFYYTALTAAALYQNGTADEQNRWRELLTAHREQLREWAENCPPTFGDKYALVLAEIARLEGRDADAMRLYEEAIRSASENGFVQNEGLAHEVAARFYAARGVKTIAHAYLREARRCYLRWGAFGKVRQLEQLHPHLREAPVPASPTATIGALADQLDVGTVLKAAQAVSGEIILGELIKTLLRIAVEHAGAERGLLILFPGDEPRIAADATTGRGEVEVTLRQTAASPAEFPESVLHYVIRTRENVILDDALAQNPFSADEYICQKHARSVLCLPLVKQTKLIGALYLENKLASHVFTPARISVLEMLASQAAISLENARLYDDLREREARIRRLVDSNIVGIVFWDVQGRIIDANQAFLDIVGYAKDDLVSGRLRWTELTPSEWRDADEQNIAELKAVGSIQPREKEYLRKDGSRVPVLIARALFEWKPDEGVSFVVDMTERKRADEALRERVQLLDLTHDTIFVRSMNDVISFWNHGAEQLYGWTKEEALDQVSHQLLRTKFPAPLEVITSELLSTDRWEGELVHTKRDGTQVTAASRWSLRRDERGRPAGILETNNDITERKRAEYLTGHVFESSPDSICIVGKDYRLQRVNPVFERVWAKPAALAVGMHAADIMGTELFERIARPSFDRCFAGEQVSIADWHATALGRKYRVITYSPLRPDSQRVEAALVIARDFTDHVQASEALRAAQMELAHVNRVTTMGQLTASIAHEVNQPISVAVTSAYAGLRWLTDQPPDVEAARNALDLIIKAGHQAGQVTDRIRALVKKVPVRKAALDINETILDTIALTRSEMERHLISLQTELTNGLPRVWGERVQLQQVILNLMMNAIEAMSEVGDGSRDLLITSSLAAADGVIVAVRDSGPGLNAETVDHLFDPFYTTKRAGLGMGLSICRSITEAHGGRLWASANAPRGTVFRFVLPLHQDDAS